MIYETHIRVRVLSNHPIKDVNLSNIADACDSGDMMGNSQIESCQPLAITDVITATQEMGGEPEFFLPDFNDPDFEMNPALTLDDIKELVNAGYTVHWKNTGYRVVYACNEYLLRCDKNGAVVALVSQRTGNLVENPRDFFIGKG